MSSTMTQSAVYAIYTCTPPSNLLFDQERVDKYRPGGYHPVALGDTFSNGRYRVAHKLGWGGFSTVWLVLDSRQQRWVALKILTAGSSSSSRELFTLQYLSRHGASDFVPQVLDSFTHSGPNGKHQCLVMELLGPSLDTVVSDYHVGGDRLEPEVVFRISKQLLQAIESIHATGYGHGDISGANVAFTATNLAFLPEKDLFDIIGVPETANLARKDGEKLSSSMPKQLVRKIEWSEWIDEDEEDIRLLDWGEAFRIGAEPATLAQPGGLEAPETIFTSKFDQRVDLWRAGCTIFTLLFAARPFQYLGDEAVVIAQMINLVGELPQEWQATWLKMQSGRSVVTSETAGLRLMRLFDDMAVEPELRCFLPIIQSLMKFLPDERKTATEVIEMLRQGQPEEENLF